MPSLSKKEALTLSDRASVQRNRGSEMRKCPVVGCGKSRARVDRHLQHEHKLEKGTFHLFVSNIKTHFKRYNGTKSQEIPKSHP